MGRRRKKESVITGASRTEQMTVSSDGMSISIDHAGMDCQYKDTLGRIFDSGEKMLLFGLQVRVVHDMLYFYSMPSLPVLPGFDIPEFLGGMTEEGVADLIEELETMRDHMINEDAEPET